MKKLLAVLTLLASVAVSAEVIHLQSFDQHRKLIESKKPIVYMFGADWCGYCKEAYPDFVKAEKLYKGKVLFIYIDTDKIQANVPYLPSYAVGDKDPMKNRSIFDQESLNKIESRDVEGLKKFIKEYLKVSL